MSENDHIATESADGPNPRTDYSEILERLEQATPFDLYRLHSALGRMLDDPAKIAQAKRLVKVGDEVEYFDPQENRCVRARVLRCNRTRAVVRDADDGQVWTVTYCAINIEGVSTTIRERRATGLGRNEVSVGDAVGFLDRDHREHYGTIVKLNPKTASVYCEDEETRWRVGYRCLFRVLDAESAGGQTIEVEALPFRRS
jgi:hypothetical protein